MPFIALPDADIFYLARGVGVPVVALHGAGGTSKQWGQQLRGLADVAQVIALDLPGHGRSTGVVGSLATYAATVDQVVEVLGFDQVILLGHSLGGAVAQLVALAQPARVRGLVLLATGARLPIDPALIDGLRSDHAATIRVLVERAYARGTAAAVIAAATADLLRVPPAVLLADYAACNSFNLRGSIEQIDVPALVLAGADDRLLTPNVTAALARLLPHATLGVIDHAAHMLMIEQANVVNDLIKQWIEKFKNQAARTKHQ